MFHTGALVGVTLALALGRVSANENQSQTTSQQQGVAPAATTSEKSARPIDPRDAAFYAAPAGASKEDWAVANEIRWLLCSDRTLPTGWDNLTIKDGRVTLHGTSLNRQQGRRLHNAIAGLPGVELVENELTAR